MKPPIHDNLPVEDLIEILDRALALPLGLRIKTTAPAVLVAQLESARLDRHVGLVIAEMSVVESLAIYHRGALNEPPSN